MSFALPAYQLRAVNTAPDSENKIHDDSVAAQYGFRGGLVPGVTVYGYMTVPIIDFAPQWLDQGSMQVRFVQPVYDGDTLVVRATVNDDGSLRVTAEREDGAVCATGTAALNRAADAPAKPPSFAALPERRPEATRETIIPGAALGTVVDTLDTVEQRRILQFSNELLVRNFALGPWIHVSSDVSNWSAPRIGDQISAHARIHDRFDRMGHEFISVDVVLMANRARLIQTVRHTAIYRIARAPV